MPLQQVLPFLPLIPLFLRKLLEVSGKKLFLGVIYTERFAAYKKAVVSAYLQKCSQAQENWLIKPTRGRIRQLCCKLVEDGLSKRDENMLYKYLEMEPGDRDFLAAIKETDADDFQGFVQFLNNTEINPAEPKVELLAWLIDFPARPYSKYIETGKDELDVAEDELKIKPPAKNDDETNLPPKDTKQEIAPIPPPVNKKDWRWLIGIAVLLIGGVILWRVWTDGKKCMYWSDDHYVATYCDVPRLDTPILPIDRAKLRGFRKIKKTDTLTSPYALRNFWYVRVADSLEIYSASGTHPLYPDKRLEAVTDYVVNFCRNHSKYGKP
ncbi:hypothetical protein [Mucilaginibacter aquariorum]|uniref:DUF4129 domain-containing protein n=1 Tax=Mucilaginibacter aquariorum TaxID=2967225 RepID=A0ABT1T9G5_9SPHI|nr:hypothetical protein [Mucilaginibacter aquariorum]MCQ6961093.1 hypothetical protein [Mucilaginibacter aquariorum]